MDCIIFSQNKYIPLHFHNGENSQYARAEEINQWLKALVTLNRSGYRSPYLKDNLYLPETTVSVDLTSP